MDENEVIRAMCLYVAVLSKPESGKPEQVIERAETFYNWIKNGNSTE